MWIYSPFIGVEDLCGHMYDMWIYMDRVGRYTLYLRETLLVGLIIEFKMYFRADKLVRFIGLDDSC